MRKFLFWTLGAALAGTAAVYAAFQLSPWPAVLLIRHSFDQGAADATAATAPLIPRGVIARKGLSYDEGDPHALFDIFSPAKAARPLPAIVWIHGGGFVSGSRRDLSGYLQILAAKGFATIAIDYTTAPEAQFPIPLRQTGKALAYLAGNAKRFNIDPDRIFLAGDSAGAQIAAQTALVISRPDYSQRIGIAPGIGQAALRGVILYCGPYDPASMNFEGPFGGFMRTVLWSYIGTRDHRDPRVGRMSVTPHVSADYPPAFISVGNADPLAPQSIALADALKARGAQVETLFFPKDRKPPLDHEYQLLLSTDAGRLALDRSASFIEAHAR